MSPVGKEPLRFRVRVRIMIRVMVELGLGLTHIPQSGHSALGVAADGIECYLVFSTVLGCV